MGRQPSELLDDPVSLADKAFLDDCLSVLEEEYVGTKSLSTQVVNMGKIHLIRPRPHMATGR